MHTLVNNIINPEKTKFSHTFKNVSHVVCQIPGVLGPQGPLGGAGLSIQKAVRALGLENKAQSAGPARDTVSIKTCLTGD